MKLEYLTIFKEDGLPIYSNCYGTICARMNQDETLLNGFLSTITNLSTISGDKKEQNIIKLESPQFNFNTTTPTGTGNIDFNTTTPSGNIICIGVEKSTYSEDKKSKIDKFFTVTTRLLDEDYKDNNWNYTTGDEMKEFEYDILHKAILPSFPLFENRDICSVVSPYCPFDHKHSQDQNLKDQPIWEGLRYRYSKQYAKQNLRFSKRIFKRLFGKPFTKAYGWWIFRKYSKNLAKQPIETG